MVQTLFVNKQVEPFQKYDSKTQQTDADKQSLKPLEGEYIKIGDSVGFAQAEELFEHTNRYAAMPSKVHNGLQAYTSIDMANKREALRSLMGVDLYA